MKRTFLLVHTTARQMARQAVENAPEGYACTIGPQTKRRAQEEKYHAMIADIARQCQYIGREWDAESMKRILIDEFALEMRQAGTPLQHDGSMIPSEDGRRVIWLGSPSSRFSTKEAGDFIEFLYAWGAARGIEWGAALLPFEKEVIA